MRYFSALAALTATLSPVAAQAGPLCDGLKKILAVARQDKFMRSLTSTTKPFPYSVPVEGNLLIDKFRCYLSTGTISDGTQRGFYACTMSKYLGGNPDAIPGEVAQCFGVEPRVHALPYTDPRRSNLIYTIQVDPEIRITVDKHASGEVSVAVMAV